MGNNGLVDQFESTYKAENPGKFVPKVGVIYLKGAYDVENPRRTSVPKPLIKKPRKSPTPLKHTTVKKKTQRTPVVVSETLVITRPKPSTFEKRRPGRASKKARIDPVVIPAIHYPVSNPFPSRK